MNDVQFCADFTFDTTLVVLSNVKLTQKCEAPTIIQI